MKNWKGEGQAVTFIAPADGVTSGVPVIVGGLFLIPAYSAAKDYECEGLTSGVFELEKVSTDTPTQFAAAYWDPTAEKVTTAADDGEQSPTAFAKIGVFMNAQLTATTVADIRLDGVSI